ncbi:MAG TPA: hypothetical protein VK921_00200 [Anditalea sp.]|nr:hypothetical protein [Anditalea sp.]
MSVLTRLVFMGMPLHSDDYLRFYWDGHLILNHINPYEFTPTQIMNFDLAPNFLKPIYHILNSQEYYSIYPVTNQTVFAFAAWIGGDSILGFVLWIRFVLVIFEMASIWILYRILTLLNINPAYTLRYALNPLILLEITGNLHFEGMMVTFIFLGILALLHLDYIKAGGWIGTAVSVKLTPLIFLPLIFKYINNKNLIWVISSFTLVCGLFFLPIFLSGTFAKFFNSIQLYYGTFEFNASIYYLLRKLGFLIKGYNMISTISLVLSLLIFILICYTAIKGKIDNIQQFLFYGLSAYFVYLLLGMVVHPWYIIPLLGLGICAGFNYPITWSYLIYLSYYAYTNDPVKESFEMIGIQYGLLFIFAIYEYAQYFSFKKIKYI